MPVAATISPEPKGDPEQLIAAAGRKWDQSRAFIAVEYPYFATLAALMQPVWTEAVPTAGVDDRARLVASPSFVDGLTDMETAGLVLHELHHLARRHCARRQEIPGADPIIWNLAADMEINPDILRDGLSMPSDPPPLVPDRYNLPSGLLAEEYYARLADDGEDGQGPGRSQQTPDDLGVGCGMCGSGAGGDDTPSGQEDSGGDADPGDGGGANREGKQQNGGGGQGEDGNGPPAAAAPSLAEIADAAGVEGTPAWQLEAAAAKAAEEAIRQAGVGNTPAWATRVSELSQRRSQVDWRRLLRDALRRGGRQRAGIDDFSWQRQNRRRPPSSTGGLLLPGMIRQELRIAVVIDTSGSMRQEEIDAAACEAVEVARSVGETVFLACDTQTSKVRPVGSRQMELVGGGGTDMAAGIEAALDEKPAVDVVIVLTDGWTPWPRKKPRRPVVVGLIGPDALDETPEWARTVKIPYQPAPQPHPGRIGAMA